ncbi:MAG: nuclear transport factor 2 family protein [Acidimicrobiia bacterium]|nr:nuclear transport factor 2 family protein [Acidimicrobiia bacterium]MCY4432801.1 nuclear transport factor 2 family protein [bacterium]
MDPDSRRAANLERIREYFDLIATGDVDELAQYWHDEIMFEAPFSFTGKPSRTVGKQAVYDRLSTSYGLVSMAFHITEIYELSDPDRFLVEYDSDGHMLGSGERYQNSYITLVEVREGLISRFREFYDSQRCSAAFGPLLDSDH